LIFFYFFAELNLLCVYVLSGLSFYSIFTFVSALVWTVPPLFFLCFFVSFACVLGLVLSFGFLELFLLLHLWFGSAFLAAAVSWSFCQFYLPAFRILSFSLMWI
jgi:hypothetical protein